MKTPDQGSSPKKEKWNNVSAVKFGNVYDLLLKLQMAGVLPEGKTADDLKDLKVNISVGLMDYAERVLADSSFWASLPEEILIITEKNHTEKKGDLKAGLLKLIQESK